MIRKVFAWISFIAFVLCFIAFTRFIWSLGHREPVNSFGAFWFAASVFFEMVSVTFFDVPVEHKPEPDWKAIAGRLYEAIGHPDKRGLYAAIREYQEATNHERNS